MSEALPLFPPPQEAASLYSGAVMHQRLKQKAHRFSYSVYNLLIDIDRLDEAHRLSHFFSVGKFNLLSFVEGDHMSGQYRSIRDQTDGLLAESGVPQRAARVLLLCYPRVLGFVFNPISVYFAYDSSGTPLALIYEVRNTFRQRHSYVIRVEPGQLSAAGIRQERNKLFYVSPFLDMAQRYYFRVRPPGVTVALRILEKDEDGPTLAATFVGDRHDLTSPRVLTAFFSFPLMTLKVVAGINFEALKLWLKGVKIRPRPEPPEPASFEDREIAR